MPALRGVEYARFLNAPESFTPDAAFCSARPARSPACSSPRASTARASSTRPASAARWRSGSRRARRRATCRASTCGASRGSSRTAATCTSARRGPRPAVRDALAVPAAAHGARHPPHAAARPARRGRRGVRRGRRLGARQLVRAGRHAARVRLQLRPPELVRARRRPSTAPRARRWRCSTSRRSPRSRWPAPTRCAWCSGSARRTSTSRVGRVVYTLMLNAGGGIELDGTVTRLAEDRFLVSRRRCRTRRRWRSSGARRRGLAAATFDATSGLATIAVMGPLARELLRPHQPGRPVERRAAVGPRGRDRGGRRLRAVPARLVRRRARLRAVPVRRPGGRASTTPWSRPAPTSGCGTPATTRSTGCDAEKGYRHLGHDIGPADDPYQAGLGVHRRARQAGRLHRPRGDRGPRRPAPDRRQVFVRLDDPEPLLLHGESLLQGGEIVGRVTSGAYGHTLGAACGLGYLRGDVPAGRRVRGRLRRPAGRRHGLRHAVLRPGQRAAAGLTERYWCTASSLLPSGSSTNAA